MLNLQDQTPGTYYCWKCKYEMFAPIGISSKNEMKCPKCQEAGMLRMEVCSGCGIEHPRVEAGGVWACPNVLCGMCGATHLKRNLPSAKKLKGGLSVPWEEVMMLAEWILSDPRAYADDPRLREGIEISLRYHKGLIDNPRGRNHRESPPNKRMALIAHEMTEESTNAKRPLTSV
jgi:hypothetical protein